MKITSRNIVFIVLFTLIILLAVILSIVYLDKNQTNSSQDKTNYIWSVINETTWWKDSGWAGETYVFYTDNNGVKKCIHQVEGSGVYIVSREFVDFKIISNNEIRIGNDIYKLNEDKLVSNDKILTLYSKKPLVYNRLGPIDMEIVKSDEFVVEDIDKKISKDNTTSTDEEKNFEQDENLPICKNWSDIQKNKDKMAFIEGTFRIFHPWTKGKGENYMFWEWEILLEDNISIPAISNNPSLDLSTFKDSIVRIKGNIFYGIIIGSEEGQNLTGYRIDIHEIWKK